MNREELAWAAGIFDGEGYAGCVDRSKEGRRHPRISLVVVQWHSPEIPLRFQAALGGLGHVGSRSRGEAEEYKWATASFEIVQASAAMLWAWLSSTKQAQIARTLEQYHGIRAVEGTRAWRRRTA